MHNHQCVCEHNLKYCYYCGIVYCLKCGEEWKKHYTYPNACSPWAQTTGGTTTIDTNMGKCVHN